MQVDMTNHQEVDSNEFRFNGKGSQLLGIMLLNTLLSIITFGIYYPWARVNRLKFFWENAELNGSPFVFHGTGKELFKGFIKVLLFIGIFYGLLLYGKLSGNLGLYFITLLAFLIALVFIIPLAIHGAMRYRLSRTSWRGIHFGYRGSRVQLITDFFIGCILTVITFGIYNSWFVNRLRTYIIGNIRFGNLRFGYDGSGTELFAIKLKSFIFSIFTFGIYYFWYLEQWTNYYINHCYIEQNGQRYYFAGRLKGSGYFMLIISNLLMSIFTLGLATPWVIIRTTHFIIRNMEIPADINFNNIAQTEDEFKDAAGDDLIDFFDLGIV
jgi:uncharacterized membrane protein YjgN (DUF898 family)